jgi:response regulator RpfG family c-di-GMP phosphodiesterase
MGFKVFMAESAAEGIALLEREVVDVVVSDMRMPVVNGSEFLAQVCERWPHTIRVLLTGYADLESAIDAINRGQPFGYLTKPWEDENLQRVLADALEMANLRTEKQRLEELTKKQNAELVELNLDLERRVEERTAQARKGAELLAQANQELRDAYGKTVEVFASLIQAGARDSVDARRLAELARLTGAELSLTAEQLQHLHLAALLSDLGKLAVPDRILRKPVLTYSAEEAKVYQEHPLISSRALLPLQPLEAVSSILRSHCERLDGEGYPDGLAGDAIPIEARVLAAVKDYDALMRGLLVADIMTSGEAIDYIREHVGKRYDAQVVDALQMALNKIETGSHRHSELRVEIRNARPGMTLTRDVLTDNGVLIVPSGAVLDEPIISKLLRISQERDEMLVIYARPIQAG